jgi:hypothetical protein
MRFELAVVGTEGFASFSFLTGKLTVHERAKILEAVANHPAALAAADLYEGQRAQLLASPAGERAGWDTQELSRLPRREVFLPLGYEAYQPRVLALFTHEVQPIA